MKHQKRIIQHLIEHSKSLGQSKVNPKFSTQQKQENSRPILCFETNQTIDQDIANISIQLQPTYSFQVFVEIGDGRSDCIVMNQKSDARQQAYKFCQKYHLEKYIVQLLAQSLSQQTKKQKSNIKNQMISGNHKQKNKKVLGGQKVLSKSKMYKYSKNSQELWKQPEQKFSGHPKINQISVQIVKKRGKDKIIQQMNKKFNGKTQQYIQDQLQNQQKQMQSYSFHPIINPISRKVDQTLNYSRYSKQNITRFEQLYEQHRIIQNKKQMKRRNSLNQISFKPFINKVSKTIIQKKRSLGDLYQLSISKQKHKSSHKNNYFQKQQIKIKSNKKYQSKRQSLYMSNQKLCYHLFQQAKKRQQKLQKEADKIYNNQNNWRIIQNSNSLVFNLRQNRIRQIFMNLSKPPHKQLSSQDIDEVKLNQVQRIFLPVFKQMKQIDTSLTEQQFIQAGLRLLKYISPNQRAILIRKNYYAVQNKENKIFCSQINKKSKQIIEVKRYGQNDIYVRGLMYKNQIKNHIEKGKEDKVRNQLKSCTFKPKINGLPQNVAY